jgi:hypothetical protein
MTPCSPIRYDFRRTVRRYIAEGTTLRENLALWYHSFTANNFEPADRYECLVQSSYVLLYAINTSALTVRTYELEQHCLHSV